MGQETDQSESLRVGGSQAKRVPRVYGLQQLYPDPSDETATIEKKIDIIVLHGLAAQSPTTWLAWKEDGDPTSGSINWLSDSNMLPSEIPEDRILTYDWNADYDKDASSDIFLGHADALLDRVHTNRSFTKRLQRPIIFIASCFGGLLLAKAIVRATSIHAFGSPENQEILRCVVGAFFLGTPFNGSWDTGSSAAQLRLAVAITAPPEDGAQWSRELIQYLKPATVDRPSPLDEMVREFNDVISRHPLRFNVVCFYETQHTDFSAVLRKLPDGFPQTEIDRNGHGIVVTRHSASLGGAELVSLDVRHNMLHKFNSPDNDGFQRMTRRLKDLTDRAEEILVQKSFFSSVKIFQNPSQADWPQCQNERPAMSAKRLVRNDVPSCLQSSSVIWSAKHNIEPRIVVVYGLAGVGKSHLCLESIADNEKRFHSVFYLDASNRASADTSYTQISQVCNVPSGGDVDLADTNRLTRAWLAGRKNPWLLMIDNADSSGVSLKNYIPRKGPGVVIITTTDERFANLSKTSCEVKPLDRQQAKKLLLRYKRIDMELCENESQAAEVLAADLLGGLPLAIAQAGSYIFNRRCKFTEYCKSFTESPTRSLDYISEPKQWPGSQRTVWKTFTISIRRIQGLSEMGAGVAVELLRTLSFLHHEGVPGQLFQKAWENMSTAPTWARYMSLLNSNSPRWDTLEIRAAISILLRYSLMAYKSPHSHEYSVHRLVHTICRESLPKPEREKYGLRAVSLLAVAISSIQTPLSWIDDPSGFEFQKAMLPHIQASLRGQIGLILQEPDIQALAAKALMILRLVKSCSAAGSFSDARALAIDIYEVLRQMSEKNEDLWEFLQTIEQQTAEQLAASEAHLGNHDRALELRIIIHDQLIKSGTEGESSCVAMMNMAGSQWMVGRKREALSTAGEVMKRRESVLDPKDPRLLRTRRKLAEYMHGLNKKREALNLRQKILQDAEKQEQTTLVQRIEFLATQNAMADSYQWDGQLHKSFKLRSDVYRGRLDILGEEHPDTLVAQDRLLGTRTSMAPNNQEMEGICRERQKLVEAFTRVYGNYHPYTLEAKVKLGYCYSSIRELTRASKEQNDVLEARQAQFDDNRTSANCMYYLSSMAAVARLSRPLKAFGIRREALSIAQQNKELVSQEAMSKIHNEFLTSWMKSSSREQGRLYILGKRKQLLAEQKSQGEDLAALYTLSSLATDLCHTGFKDNAIKQRTKLLEKQCSLVGEDNPRTLRNKKRLALLLFGGIHGDNSSYSQSGREKALELMEQAERVETNYLGSAHYRTIRTRKKILTMYRCAGELAKARGLSEIMGLSLQSLASTENNFHHQTSSSITESGSSPWSSERFSLEPGSESCSGPDSSASSTGCSESSGSLLSEDDSRQSKPAKTHHDHGAVPRHSSPASALRRPRPIGSRRDYDDDMRQFFPSVFGTDNIWGLSDESFSDESSPSSGVPINGTRTNLLEGSKEYHWVVSVLRKVRRFVAGCVNLLSKVKPRCRKRRILLQGP